MTEAEWLAATDPRLLLNFLDGKSSNRKLHMFSLACWSAWPWQPDESGEYLRKFEQYADALITREEYASYAEEDIVEPWQGAWLAIRFSEKHLEAHRHVSFIRDIFGNPFRPVTFLPEWRTSTVLSLARGIYSDRAFDRMPILADALKDAGCDNEELLNHCRAETVHTRGCFAIDLILGKE